MDKSIYKKMRRLYLTHPEVEYVWNLFTEKTSQLYHYIQANEPAELNRSKLLNYLKFESKLSVALRAMNYAFNRKTGQLNTIDQCSDRLLQDVCVANFAMTFHESIQSDRMEFDWQRALDSMKLHNKLILMLKGERETFQPTTPSPPPWSAEAVNGDDNEASPIVIATEDDEIHVISDDASEENSRSATPIPTNGMNRDDLNVRKRSAEQSDDDCEAKHSRMMGESSNVSENKLSIDKEETGTRDLTVDISCVVANNDDQREKRTIEMVTKFRGGKIIIEIN